MPLSFELPPENGFQVLQEGMIRLRLAESRSFSQLWKLSGDLEAARGLPLCKAEVEPTWWEPSIWGWRYLLLNEGRPFAFADLEPDFDGVLSFRNLIQGPSLNGFVAAFKTVRDVAADQDGVVYLRLLEFAHIGLRMFWLKGQVDQFVTIRPVFGRRRFKRVMTLAEVKRRIRQLSRLRASIDDEPKLVSVLGA